MGAVLAIALLVVSPCAAHAAQVATGRWEYRLAWNGITAANAVVEVSRDTTTPEPAYRVDAVARTNWLIDLLWKLRARAAARFSNDAMVPLGFRYDHEIRGEPRVTEVIFQAAEPGVRGISRRRGRTKVVDIVDAGVVDPITAIFQALHQPLEVGKRLPYDVFNGTSRYRVEIEVVGEERVRVAGRTYRAWRVSPRVWKIGKGLDERLRNATVWVSQGPERSLLRLRSEVFIGSVTCDLVKPPDLVGPS